MTVGMTSEAGADGGRSAIKPVPATPVVVIGPNRFCLIRAAEAATGYSEKAIRRKIEDGVWIEGKHWRRAPDGHIFIDLAALNAWIMGDAGADGQRAA
jgi:hypothetical protein